MCSLSEKRYSYKYNCYNEKKNPQINLVVTRLSVALTVIIKQLLGIVMVSCVEHWSRCPKKSISDVHTCGTS